MTIIDTPEGLALFQVLQRKHAIRLELRGLKVSRRSVTAFVKKLHGFKGNRAAVYAQYCMLHGLAP